MCSKTEFNPPFIPYFFVILTVVYSPILASTVIQKAHAVHAYTQFTQVIGKQSYGNDCSS